MDREKIIKGLENTAEYFRHLQSIGFFGDQPIFREHETHCNDAIALLKEQEAERLEFIEAIAKLTAENELLKKPEIVRCRYCKHEKTCCRRRTDNPDWFCADGKRRDDRPKGDKE